MMPIRRSSGAAIVGITGHRHLADPEDIAYRIQQALDAVEREFRVHRIELLSALAEGADRLVAQAVSGRQGGALVAVLPLPVAEYLQDFDEPESQQEFKSLLDSAERTIHIESPGRRKEAYLAAGVYILDHCQVLLAVWDGKPARGVGGTADIVGRARRQGLPLILIHSERKSSEEGSLVFESFPPSKQAK
jgi:hypothetical protein